MSQHPELARVEGVLEATGAILASVTAQFHLLQTTLENVKVSTPESEAPPPATPQSGKAATAEKADVLPVQSEEKEAAPSATPTDKELTEADVSNALMALTKLNLRDKAVAILATLPGKPSIVPDIKKADYATVIEQAKKAVAEAEVKAAA